MAAKASAPLPACGFSVSGSKKGGLPVALEKRPKGKKVTVISNVQGSAQSLVSALNSLLGCGGTCKQEASGQHWTVEVQGDHLERVSRALEDFGCLRGVKKDAPVKEKKKEVEVAARSYGYDKFLRRGEPERGEKSAKSAPIADDWFAGADCAKWHGPWTYCRGNCQQIDAGDVWEETLNGCDDQELPKVQPERFRSFAELNLILRGLGMLAEVGRAAAIRETKPGAPALTLNQYRQNFLAPGSRLIDDAGVPSASSQSNAPREKATRLAAPRAFHPPASGSSRPAKKASSSSAQVQPKQGEFQCLVCHATFGLQKTLKMHMQRAHYGEQPVFQLPASKPPAVKPQPTPAQPARPRPAGSGLSRKPRPGGLEDSRLSTSRSEEYIDYSDYEEEEQEDRPSNAGTGTWPKLAEATDNKPDPFKTDAWTAERLAITEALGLSRKAKRDFKRRYSNLRRQGLDIEEAWVCAIESVCQDELVCSPAAATTESEYCLPSQGRAFDSDSDEVIAATVVSGAQTEASAKAATIEGAIPCFVVSDWHPDAGAEHQIRIREGCMVLVEWEQPTEEGGYWAYGHCCDDPRQTKGYFPRHCVECGG
mmetsp:Transcript_40919/g.73962  ORF Transcript_40919/g.73962 Transcript_40919/m.73962 type:complete len:595 (+) Transcript_40919:24-1808(+)